MRTIEVALIPATADAESGPDLLVTPGECRLRYCDYRNISHDFLFEDVIQVEYQPSSHPRYVGLSDDGQYEVLDSQEISELKKVGEIPNDMRCHHYLLGFNEHGGVFVSIITGSSHPISWPKT